MGVKKEILVVERNLIFDKGYFQGFVTNDLVDLSDKIMQGMKLVKQEI